MTIVAALIVLTVIVDIVQLLLKGFNKWLVACAQRNEEQYAQLLWRAELQQKHEQELARASDGVYNVGNHFDNWYNREQMQ